VCILLEFSGSLCAGIDYCMSICVFMLKSCELVGT
jgi:hypothetical protein